MPANRNKIMARGNANGLRLLMVYSQLKAVTETGEKNFTNKVLFATKPANPAIASPTKFPIVFRDKSKKANG
jgi:hypothetical protein